MAISAKITSFQIIESVIKRAITSVFATSKTTNLSKIVFTKKTLAKAIKISIEKIRAVICHIANSIIR